MSDDYDDYDGCMCLSDECPECGTECTKCGGEQYVECDDPIQCCAEHIGDPFAGGEHPCPACYGSGLRSKQWIF